MTTSSAPTTARSNKSNSAMLGTATVHRLKHPGRWVAVALIILLFASVIYIGFTNPRFRWDVVAEYFFSAPVLDGLRITLTLTIIGMVIGVVLGTVVALMRLSVNPILKLSLIHI